MNAIDKLQLLAELDDEFCQLNHGPVTVSTDYPACDYIVLPVGYRQDPHTDVVIRNLVIPVCLDCARALLGEQWTLLYCLDCCASQWICRDLARLRYRHHILWLCGCPKCAEKTAGIFSNDFPAVDEEPVFLRGAPEQYAA